MSLHIYVTAFPIFNGFLCIFAWRTSYIILSCLHSELASNVIMSFLSLQAICGFVTARIIFVVPQTYLPLYLTDTLRMKKVRFAGGDMYHSIDSALQLLR